MTDICDKSNVSLSVFFKKCGPYADPKSVMALLKKEKIAVNPAPVQLDSSETIDFDNIFITEKDYKRIMGSLNTFDQFNCWFSHKPLELSIVASKNAWGITEASYLCLGIDSKKFLLNDTCFPPVSVPSLPEILVDQQKKYKEHFIEKIPKDTFAEIDSKDPSASPYKFIELLLELDEAYINSRIFKAIANNFSKTQEQSTSNEEDTALQFDFPRLFRHCKGIENDEASSSTLNDIKNTKDKFYAPRLAIAIQIWKHFRDEGAFLRTDGCAKYIKDEFDLTDAESKKIAYVILPEGHKGRPKSNKDTSS